MNLGAQQASRASGARLGVITSTLVGLLVGLGSLPGNAEPPGVDVAAASSERNLIEAPDEVLDRLIRMNDAVRERSYRATYVQVRDGRLLSLRISHGERDGSDVEHLQSLNGPRLEVIREGGRVFHIWPEHQVAMVDASDRGTSFPVVLPDIGRGITDHYHLLLGPLERVAGRPAQRVVLEPRDTLRYGYELWLDQATGILLNFRLVDLDGSAVKEVLFVDIEFFDELPERAAKGELNLDGYSLFRQERKRVAESTERQVWRFAELPPGFARVGHSKRELPNGDGPVHHLVVSDGLASVSVFIEPKAPQTGLEGRESMGSLNTFWCTIGGFRLMAMGEAPTDTVEQVGRAIRGPGGAQCAGRPMNG